MIGSKRRLFERRHTARSFNEASPISVSGSSSPSKSFSRHDLSLESDSPIFSPHLTSNHASPNVSRPSSKPSSPFKVSTIIPARSSPSSLLSRQLHNRSTNSHTSQDENHANSEIPYSLASSLASSSPPINNTSTPTSASMSNSSASSSSSSLFAIPLEYYDSESLEYGKRLMKILKLEELRNKFVGNLYEKLATQSHIKELEEKGILKDVTRTFPHHALFRQDPESATLPPSSPSASLPLGSVALTRILLAYSSYDPEIGYSQGMAFLAGFLLMHIPDEESTFWCLVTLMFDWRYNLRCLYNDGCKMLKFSLLQLELMISLLLPSLNAHFEQEGIKASMYATQWFLCLYSYRLPLNFTRAFWLKFASDGIACAFSTAVSILAYYQQHLKTLSFEMMVPFLSFLPGDIPESVVWSSSRYPVPKQVIAVGSEMDKKLQEQQASSEATTSATKSTSKNNNSNNKNKNDSHDGKNINSKKSNKSSKKLTQEQLENVIKLFESF